MKLFKRKKALYSTMGEPVGDLDPARLSVLKALHSDNKTHKSVWTPKSIASIAEDKSETVAMTVSLSSKSSFSPCKITVTKQNTTDSPTNKGGVHANYIPNPNDYSNKNDRRNLPKQDESTDNYTANISKPSHLTQNQKSLPYPSPSKSFDSNFAESNHSTCFVTSVFTDRASCGDFADFDEGDYDKENIARKSSGNLNEGTKLNDVPNRKNSPNESNKGNNHNTSKPSTTKHHPLIRILESKSSNNRNTSKTTKPVKGKKKNNNNNTSSKDALAPVTVADDDDGNNLDQSLSFEIVSVNSEITEPCYNLSNHTHDKNHDKNNGSLSSSSSPSYPRDGTYSEKIRWASHRIVQQYISGSKTRNQDSMRGKSENGNVFDFFMSLCLHQDANSSYVNGECDAK